MHVTLIGFPSNNYFLQVDVKNLLCIFKVKKIASVAIVCLVLTVNCAIFCFVSKMVHLEFVGTVFPLK